MHNIFKDKIKCFRRLIGTMKKILTILALLSFSCTKVDLMRDVPECIEVKIREFAKSESICDSGSEVNEYRFQGDVVYTFFTGDCGADRGSLVYDDQCNVRGGLGGFGNITELNGLDFASNAVFIGKVWGN